MEKSELFMLERQKALINEVFQIYVFYLFQIVFCYFIIIIKFHISLVYSNRTSKFIVSIIYIMYKCIVLPSLCMRESELERGMKGVGC